MSMVDVYKTLTFFDSFVNLVPADHYIKGGGSISRTSTDNQESSDVSRGKASSKKAHKDDRNTLKRQRYDPSQLLATTEQIRLRVEADQRQRQKDLKQIARAEKREEQMKRATDGKRDQLALQGGGFEFDDDEQHQNGDALVGKKRQRDEGGDGDGGGVAPMLHGARGGGSVSREELRERLHAVLRKQRADRKADEPKRGRKGRNRREQQAKEALDQVDTNQQQQRQVSKAPAAAAAAGAIKEDIEYGDFVFKKSVAESDHTLLEPNAPGSKKRKIQADLKKIREERQALEVITDVEERKRREAELAMERAMQKAQGEQVRTDASRLKKSQKAQEKKKEKSRQQWADRKKAVEEGKKERQEQRAENIANYRGKRKGAKGKADAQHKTD